MQESSD